MALCRCGAGNGFATNLIADYVDLAGTSGIFGTENSSLKLFWLSCTCQIADARFDRGFLTLYKDAGVFKIPKQNQRLMQKFRTRLDGNAIFSGKFCGLHYVRG